MSAKCEGSDTVAYPHYLHLHVARHRISTFRQPQLLSKHTGQGRGNKHQHGVATDTCTHWLVSFQVEHRELAVLAPANHAPAVKREARSPAGLPMLLCLQHSLRMQVQEDVWAYIIKGPHARRPPGLPMPQCLQHSLDMQDHNSRQATWPGLPHNCLVNNKAADAPAYKNKLACYSKPEALGL
eukprot:1136510-Pelagomonas_calceolata.AAC.3